MKQFLFSFFLLICINFSSVARAEVQDYEVNLIEADYSSGKIIATSTFKIHLLLDTYAPTFGGVYSGTCNYLRWNFKAQAERAVSVANANNYLDDLISSTEFKGEYSKFVTACDGLGEKLVKKQIVCTSGKTEGPWNDKQNLKMFECKLHFQNHSLNGYSNQTDKGQIIFENGAVRGLYENRILLSGAYKRLP